MNLGTLLLSKPTQAELKKLLKFLYLTSNNTAAPRLSSEVSETVNSCSFPYQIISFLKTILETE